MSEWASDEVRCEAGVVRATARTTLLRRYQAVALCTNIQRAAAECDGHKALRMDLAAIANATPAAGWYVIQQLRVLPVERIALVGGNAAIRLFAWVVLRVGGFPRHRFFARAADADAWLASTAPTPSPSDRETRSDADSRARDELPGGAP